VYVHQPRTAGPNRRSRRGGVTYATASATLLRRPRRDGTERQLRHAGATNAIAEAQKSGTETAIKVRGHYKRDRSGVRG
jgi:hypothetical protein